MNDRRIHIRVPPIVMVNRDATQGLNEQEATMDDAELLAGEFERNRSRLHAVAYRMLGSISDADDAVQEAWLRLNRSDPDAIANLPGWLTTVVSQPPRFSISSASDRLSRSHASWTASSASLIEPSIR